MSRRFYFVRHGRTGMNMQGLIQGRTNSKLNDDGRNQASLTGDFFKNEGIVFDKVYSSPLDRAFETACIISGWNPKDIIKDERLLEFNFGIYEGVPISEIVGTEGEALFLDPKSFVPKKGESYPDLVKRAAYFLDEIKENEMGESVLVLCHGAVLSALILNIKGYDIDRFWEPDIKNCITYLWEPDINEGEIDIFFPGFEKYKG